MASDERWDWIDRTMAGSSWEPPAGFAERVVVRAMTALPRRQPQPSRLGVWSTMLATVAGFRGSMQARLEGLRWVLLQYRRLIWH